MKKTVKHYIDDLSEFTDRIADSFNGKTEQDFASDLNLQDATLRRIQVIGEIVKRLPKGFTDKYPQIPWRKIAGTRDKLTHDYDGINFERVWLIATKDIPEFSSALKTIEHSENFKYSDGK